jgi:DNA-3-methyladenine glycosylase
MTAWFELPAARVTEAARDLLGWRLADADGVVVRLTEVEAYAGQGLDSASHAHRGPTPRTQVMFGPAGVLYAYFTYGMHWCLNVVTGQVGEASAVLLRAGEVVEGEAVARTRRPSVKASRDLARGPARLAMTLGADGSFYGTNLLDGSGPLRLLPPAAPVDPELIEAGPRVGVSSEHDRPWRFWLRDDPTVSVYKRHTPRRRAAER